MDQITKFGPLQAIVKFWGTLNSTQRVITVVFASTSIVLLAIVSMIATKPKMAVLFSGLQSEDAGAVIAKLQETKIPYEIDGGVIKIPEKNVYETRMQLANQGLPQGGNVGFELFDKSNFGMTEFDQKLKYQRALQGELARSIDQLDQVAESKVILSIPAESLFEEKEKFPTASVTLKLRSSGTLSQDQVAGIVHLVSSAVEGLTPERVTVVDTRGNMLSEPGGDPTGFDMRLNSSQLKLKRGYEQQMERDIQSMLEGVLGPNKAVVRVNTDINFDRKEENNERYEPGQSGSPSGVLSSEDKLIENYGDASNGTAGAPGVSSNIGSGMTRKISGNPNGYSRAQTTARYEVSKTTEHIISAPGQVKRVCVAILLDSKVDSDKRNSIQKAVSAAAGIDETRGDVITVETIAFDTTAEKTEQKEMAAIESKNTMLSVAKTVGGVLLLLAFLIFLKGVVKQINLPGKPEEIIVTPSTPQGIDLVSSERVGTAPPPGALQGYDSTPGSDENSRAAFAGAQPEQVAQALRKWLSE